MASLLVVIELIGDRPRPASLELLGQARRVASSLGATVYAVAPCTGTPGYGDDDLIAILSRTGADKVLLAASEAHAAPLRWGTHGGAVLAACALMHPVLVMLADGEGARDLGGRVASRLGAAALCDAYVEACDGRLVIGEGEGGRLGPARLDGELDFAVLALVPPGRYAPATGDEEAEVEVLEPPSAERDFELVGDGGDWPTCSVLGEGEVATQLARALGGTTGGLGAAELRIAIGEGCERLAGFRGESSCRIAVGESASRVSAAHYAVEGPAAELGRALAEALATPGSKP